jgi:hypothetical protein
VLNLDFTKTVKKSGNVKLKKKQPKLLKTPEKTQHNKETQKNRAYNS